MSCIKMFTKTKCHARGYYNTQALCFEDGHKKSSICSILLVNSC